MWQIEWLGFGLTRIHIYRISFPVSAPFISMNNYASLFYDPCWKGYSASLLYSFIWHGRRKGIFEASIGSVNSKSKQPLTLTYYTGNISLNSTPHPPPVEDNLDEYLIYFIKLPEYKWPIKSQPNKIGNGKNLISGSWC